MRWGVVGLLDNSAMWVVSHTDHYPCPQNPYGECACFDSCKEGDYLDTQRVKDELIADLDELVVLLDNYFVNLEPDEQYCVSQSLSEFKRILAYC